MRRHEVTKPVAGVLDAEGARILDKLVQARRWDLYTESFEDEGHFAEYLDATGGGLMWAAARALGGEDEAAFRIVGRASALAKLFLAVPRLESAGRKPLVDGRESAIRVLAGKALNDVMTTPPPKAGRAAALAAWRARALLARAQSDPGRVARGDLAESEFNRRWRLITAGWSV